MTFPFNLHKTRTFLLLFLFLCLILADSASCIGKRMSFEFNGQPMTDVANQISAQLNYKILMDDKLATVPISGQFNNVTLDEFFSRRIFRGLNIVILFDDTNQTIKITTLGEKNNLTIYDNKRTAFKKNNSLELEVMPGLSRRDITESIVTISPTEIEIVPGLNIRDVVEGMTIIDPMEIEVLPGLPRRNVVESIVMVAPMEIEVLPGLLRQDIVESISTVAPMEIEAIPGLRRGNIIDSKRTSF